MPPPSSGASLGFCWSFLYFPAAYSSSDCCRVVSLRNPVWWWWIHGSDCIGLCQWWPSFIASVFYCFVEVSYIFLQHTVALTVVVLSACVALYGGDESMDQTALAFVSDDPNLLPQHSSVIGFWLYSQAISKKLLHSPSISSSIGMAFSVFSWVCFIVLKVPISEDMCSMSWLLKISF